MSAQSDWQFGRAEETLKSAIQLRRKGRDWPNIDLLTGLSVEQSLWAIRLKRTGLLKPDYEKVRPVHDLEKLAQHCGIQDAIVQECRKSKAFTQNWKTVIDWDSSARFRKVPIQDAKDIFLAVQQPTYGLMAWLRASYQTV